MKSGSASEKSVGKGKDGSVMPKTETARSKKKTLSKTLEKTVKKTRQKIDKTEEKRTAEKDSLSLKERAEIT